MSDDAQPVTKGDVRFLAEQLAREMRSGFTGVHERQDITNGRINKLESEQSRQDERMKGLQRAVYSRRVTDRQPSDDPPKDSERRPITRREVYVAGGAIAATVAVLRFLGMLVRALPLS